MKNCTQLSPVMSSKKQRGFTIVELLVVLAIIAVLGIIGIPKARGIITDGKVAPTANDTSKVVSKMRSNFAGNGATPYTTLGAVGPATAIFANSSRGLVSALTVTGVGVASTIQHDIGATNSQITVLPGTISVLGDAFNVTFNTVNEAACPGLAASLSKSADVILINGVNVKTAITNYNASAAQNACAANDANTFVFTFR